MNEYWVAHYRGVAGIDDDEIEECLVWAADAPAAIRIVTDWPDGENPEASNRSGAFSDYWSARRADASRHEPKLETNTGVIIACSDRIKSISMNEYEDRDSRFDYKNQVWTEKLPGDVRRYASCCHSVDLACECFGRAHAGQPVEASALARIAEQGGGGK